MNRVTRRFAFAFSLLFVTVVALSIIPGLDIAAWLTFQPANFWQKLILGTVEVVTLWPRLLLGGLIFGLGSKLALEIFE